MQEHKLTLFPSPPHTEISSTRLENLTAVLTFLDTHMFPCLPEAQKQLMSRSIYKPIATGVLNHLLIPPLPSSFILLSSFLDLVQKAVDFESQHIKMVGDAAAERTIKTWQTALEEDITSASEG
jgi:centromere/kinetochore protein ZW10